MERPCQPPSDPAFVLYREQRNTEPQNNAKFVVNASHRETHFFMLKIEFQGGKGLTSDKTAVVTTERRIGKVTYTICASASQRATETLDKKIKSFIRRDVEQYARSSN